LSDDEVEAALLNPPIELHENPGVKGDSHIEEFRGKG
jgi:hypothetical protein